MAQLSIIELNYDILRHICVLSSCTSRESLKNLSRASKHLRDVAIPFVFEAVTIRGDWGAALHRLEEMENSAGLLSHVKSVRMLQTIVEAHVDFLADAANSRHRSKTPKDLNPLPYH
jgi:hypothetical protein